MGSIIPGDDALVICVVCAGAGHLRIRLIVGDFELNFGVAMAKVFATFACEFRVTEMEAPLKDMCMYMSLDDCSRRSLLGERGELVQGS
jgi:hypothetical protein